MAGGAVYMERLIQRINMKWLKPVTVSILVISGGILLPLSIPILPVESFIAYSKTIGLWDHIKMEKNESDTLPLHFVYRFGWGELVEQVAEVYNRLSENEKAQCGVLANWYGPAGAIDYFGPKYGLPKAISVRNNYWLWGPRDYTGEVMITIGYEVEGLEKMFGKVDRAVYFEHPYAYNATICICREPISPLKTLWPKFKIYI